MDLKKIKWHYLLNRKQTLLFRSLTHAPHKYYKGIKGMPWQANYVLHFGEGDFFIVSEDFAKFQKLCSAEGLKFFSGFKKNLISKVEALDKITAEMENIDAAKLSDEELAFHIEEYARYALLAHWFLSPFPLSDKILSDKILSLLPGNDDLKKQEWLKILTSPARENEHTKEEKAFYALVMEAQHKKLTAKKLNHHLKKFGWIGGRYLWEEAWTEGDLKNRLNYFLSQKKNPQVEYRHLCAVKENSLHSFKELIKELNIKKSSELYKYILLAREFGYLRTWRTDIIYHAFFRTKNIFCELACRAGLKNPDNILFLTFEEAIEAARGKKLSISLKELAARKSFTPFCSSRVEPKSLREGPGKTNLSF